MASRVDPPRSARPGRRTERSLCSCGGVDRFERIEHLAPGRVDGTWIDAAIDGDTERCRGHAHRRRRAQHSGAERDGGTLREQGTSRETCAASKHSGKPLGHAHIVPDARTQVARHHDVREVRVTWHAAQRHLYLVRFELLLRGRPGGVHGSRRCTSRTNHASGHLEHDDAPIQWMRAERATCMRRYRKATSH